MKKILIITTCIIMTTVALADDNMSLFVDEKGTCDANPYMNKSLSIMNFKWDVEGKLKKNEIGNIVYVTPMEYYYGTQTVKCTWLEFNYTDYTYIPKSHTWKISCKDNPILIDPPSMTLEPEETRTINAKLTYTDFKRWDTSAFQHNLEYYSKNKNVARVDYGVVTGIAPGKTYIVVSSNRAKDDAKCEVIVENINVESATVSSPISIFADQSTDLKVTVSPSNATIKTQVWETADPSIASIDRNTGQLTGKWPGTTKVWCTVNGTVKSNEAEVTVTEPSFTFSGFSVENEATGIETLPSITATYSLALSQGDHINEITLKDNSGNEVNGTRSINGTMLTFKPSKHLLPLTRYTLTIPAGAVKNKWGTAFSTSRSVTFTTTDWQRMTLEVLPEGKFLNCGDQITLTCSEPTATIYYSTDGSNPSQRYTEPLTFEGGSITLRAMAKLDGYYDTDLIEKEFFQSVEVVEKFPDTDPLYNYADANPSITYSYPIEQGNAFNDITVTDIGGKIVDCQLIIQGQTLYIVPTEPLLTGSAYTVTVPEGSLFTDKGEENKALDWRFSTGDYSTTVSTGGPELMAAIKTDGSLWTWGQRITSANSTDGSYSYTEQKEPSNFVASDVVAVSSGYMHHALLKRDGSLWMWGRQLCGEFGNGSTTASAQPIKVMDGVKQVSCGLQTTAIVKEDGTLWMCGRNDQGQIDDSRTVHTSFIKVADGVSKATLHWGSIDIIRTDGSTEVRTWDANADEGRMPTETGLADATQVEYGWQSAVALGQDGSVWTWGQDHSLSEVIAGRNPQPLEGIRLLMPSMHLEVGERTIIAQRPMPLLADYSELTWHTSNADIATINSRGLVEALSDGYTTVTAAISDAQGQRYEAQCNITVGNANTIQTLSLAKGWNWISTYLQEPQSVSGLADGSSRIVSQEQELIRDPQFGMVGSLTAMEPGKAYKVEADNDYNCMFGGSLYDNLSPITLKKGWNWIGYPMAHTMAPGEALANAESEEGELLIGQDGMAVYSDGQWTGTLTEMVPGQGFMYRSASDKNLFYNAMAQASSRRAKVQYSSYNLLSAIPNDWTVDKHRYPNVMGLIAQLWIDQTLADAGEWILGAFSADECRGIAMAIDGNGTSEAVLMMNVYGSGGEPIAFCVVNRETGEVLQAIEQEPFRADVVGTMSQPYALHIGTVTGVQTVAADARHAAVYDLQGRRVDGVQAGKGIYVVSGGKRSRAQKIVKK